LRILAIADVHGTEEAKDVVNDQIKEHAPDLVLVCGDITQFGPPEWAKRFLDNITQRSFALPGNCDPKEVVAAIEKSKATLIHGKKEEFNGQIFVGLGGSNPTPFGTPFEFSEDEIYTVLDDVMVEDAVLAVHAPALGHLDKTGSRSGLGSRAILDIVKKYSPKLVVSAHIHEARGVENEGKTTFVNPGPASMGNAAVIDINGVIHVELIGL
jgi:Icc-related predicted phosphoesterase